MEIFKQTPLRLKFDPTESVDAINWGEGERYSQSVEACIDGDESDLSGFPSPKKQVPQGN